MSSQTQHPVGHSFGHPRFWGHSRGHSLGDPCSWSAGWQLSGPFPPTLFPSFSPVFPLLALFTLPPLLGCGFLAYSWKLPAYSGAFLLTIDNFSFFTYTWSFFAYNFSFFTYNWSFFAYSGTVHLIRALRDCKQRSLTVSKKAPTVSKKASLPLLPS